MDARRAEQRNVWKNGCAELRHAARCKVRTAWQIEAVWAQHAIGDILSKRRITGRPPFFGNPCTKTAMFWPNPHSEHHGIRPRARRCFQRAVETRENARPPAQKASKKLPIALFDDAQNAILTRTDSKPCTVPHGEANRSQSKGPYGELQAWRAGTGSNLYAYGINSV